LAHISTRKGRKVPPCTCDGRRRKRITWRERPHCVRFRLFFKRDDKNGLKAAGFDESCADDGGRSTDGSCGVHAQAGFADSAECGREEELRHHDAFKGVGGGAEHDGVDICKTQIGVFEGAECRFPHESRKGYIFTNGGVTCLSNAYNGASFTHASASRMQIRFCWSAGPLVACAS